MRHAGLQAVTAASAAGLSYDEIRRKQASAEGVQFQSGAQQVFRQYDAQQAELARQREAEARQVERLRQMEIGQRTQAANTARAGLESKFQISSGSRSPETAGTQGFKRRKLQVNPASYNAVSSGLSSSTTSMPGVLNV